MAKQNISYPASLDVEYEEKHDRLTAFFRLFLAIPILIVLCLLTSAPGGSLAGGIFTATLLLIVFRQRYPRWWFDFNLELIRFSTRVFAYLFLLSDNYPSTVDKQSVRLELKYPNAKADLNRWLPLVKWLLALPHYFLLAFLTVAAIFASLLAWFAILFTGRYPKGLFDFVVGVVRWGIRVNAYVFMLITDEYPPFSLS